MKIEINQKIIDMIDELMLDHIKEREPFATMFKIATPEIRPQLDKAVQEFKANLPYDKFIEMVIESLYNGIKRR